MAKVAPLTKEYDARLQELEKSIAEMAEMVRVQPVPDVVVTEPLTEPLSEGSRGKQALARSVADLIEDPASGGFDTVTILVVGERKHNPEEVTVNTGIIVSRKDKTTLMSFTGDAKQKEVSTHRRDIVTCFTDLLSRTGQSIKDVTVSELTDTVKLINRP